MVPDIEASAGNRDFSRVLPGVRNEVSNRVDRTILTYDEDNRIRSPVRNGHEVIDAVVRLERDRLSKHVRQVIDGDVIARLLGPRSEPVPPHLPACAGPVHDHDRATKITVASCRLAHDSRLEVGRPAR